MDDIRGGSGLWCPDCGAGLAFGQAFCHQCGLDYLSPVARDAERANGQLHRIKAQLAQLADEERAWLKYRKDILAYARRAPVDRGAGLDGAPVMGAPAEGSLEPTASMFQPPMFQPPMSQPQAFRPQAFQQPIFESPTPYAERAAATAFASQRPYSGTATAPVAMRPAKRLTAPVLLGIAGAALFILAGIVFVAASWSIYVPAARMAILLAFAGLFAFLARTATRHGFTAVGGALGVVSAAFVGVGVYALTAGPDGPAPYTTAIAVAVAAFAGLALTRLTIKAVGEVASAAMVFAVQAAAVEGALREPELTVAMAIYVFVATIGGAAIFFARLMWPAAAQRATAAYGGMATVFFAALIAVCVPLSVADFDALALSVVLVSAAACAGIAAMRPTWGAGVLVGTLTVGAMTTASMWILSVGQLTVVSALAVVVVALGLGKAPVAWRTPGLWGLTPALAGIALVLVFPAVDGLPRAFTGLGASGESFRAAVGGLSWFGVALVVIAALPLVTARWSPPRLADAGWAWGAAAVSFALGTAFLALDGAYKAAHGAGAAGAGFVLAATVQWLVAPAWGTARKKPVRSVAVALATVGGLHGAGAVAAAMDLRAQLVWGTAAVLGAMAALAGAALSQRHAAAGCSLVAIGGVSAWTWHASSSLGFVTVAAALAALVIAVAATRLPADFASPVLLGSTPAFVATGLGLAGGALVAASVSLWAHEPGLFAGYGWLPVLGACVVIAGPVIAKLAARVGVDSPSRVTQVVTGIGFIALVLAALARLQQALADSEGTLSTVADSSASALAAAVGALAFGVVALVRWWRPARGVVGIGVVSIAGVHGVVGLVRLQAEAVDTWWAVGAILATAAGLGVAARWAPKTALAPAVGLATLVAPSALSSHHSEIALAVGAVLAALVAWTAKWVRGVHRTLVLIGGGAVMLVAAVGGLYAAGLSVGALGHTWAGDAVGWRPWMIVIATALVVATLAWPRARRGAGPIVAAALVIVAGLVPAPWGWLGLAVIGAGATEAAARWRRQVSLHPFVALGVSFASVAWSLGHVWTAAVTIGALAASSLWTAIRAADGPIRVVALVLAPLAGATSVFLALQTWGVSAGVSVTIATGTALTMPLIAAAVGLDSRRQVAVWILGVASGLGPLLTADLGLAGLVVVLACAAWFTLSTMGTAWARWVALGGLSVAAMLLAADVGVATLEVYTAVPALTMIAVGLWWLRRDPRIRTYFALAPGLGAALVPSYLALALNPEVFPRTLSLVGAALVLAIVGVALRWFAPLLATAVTTVVIALSQATVGESLLPLWLSVSIIGAVLFALALLAEKIKAMR